MGNVVDTPTDSSGLLNVKVRSEGEKISRVTVTRGEGRNKETTQRTKPEVDTRP